MIYLITQQNNSENHV